MRRGRARCCWGIGSGIIRDSAAEWDEDGAEKGQRCVGPKDNVK
jgi:hypothetical protein